LQAAECKSFLRPSVEENHGYRTVQDDQDGAGRGQASGIGEEQLLHAQTGCGKSMPHCQGDQPNSLFYSSSNLLQISHFSEAVNERSFTQIKYSLIFEWPEEGEKGFR